mmetsp:Transcript_29507/g.43528  ORF Transcript_29507/g.43528 Transcript_29507/m.43528 type:complete len:291 (-) Transcript_29507:132-1004(-)
MYMDEMETRCFDDSTAMPSTPHDATSPSLCVADCDQTRSHRIVTQRLKGRLSHLAILLDGNRTFARNHGLAIEDGYRLGMLKGFEAVFHCVKLKIPVLTMWVTSLENWSRQKDEIFGLHQMVQVGMMEQVPNFQTAGVKVIFIGDRHDMRLPDGFANTLDTIESATAHCTQMVVQLAINYSGRDEIRRAVMRAALDEQHRFRKEEFTLAEFESYLDGVHHEVDLVIRVGGKKRLSGFLPYQVAMAELMFIGTTWPAMTMEELDSCLISFCERERTFGGNVPLTHMRKSKD